MIEINLYKNYKLSLADIYKSHIADSEILVTDYQPTPVKSGGTKKFLLTFLTATFIFALIATAVIIVINPFNKPLSPTMPFIEIPTAVPVTEDPDSNYVRIQIIEFADTSSGISAAARNTTPVIEVLPSRSPVQGTTNQKTNSIAPATQKPKITTFTPPSTKPEIKTPPPSTTVLTAPLFSLYSLQLDNATPLEYELFKNLTDTDAAITIQAESNYSSAIVWTVYLPKNGSGIFIEGVEVAPESSFTARTEAVNFAQKYESGTVIIKMENKSYLNYNIKVCCMSLEDAKIYAQNSGVTDKIFKLKKEQ